MTLRQVKENELLEGNKIKHTKKFLLLSIVLLFCFALAGTAYAGGGEIPLSSADNGMESGVGWSWDRKTLTLTLSGTEAVNDNQFAFALKDGGTVVLADDCNQTSMGLSSDKNVTIKGNGTLSVWSINVDNLIIESGHINAIGKESTNGQIFGYSVSCRSYTQNGGVTTIAGTLSADAVAVAGGEMTINNQVYGSSQGGATFMPCLRTEALNITGGKVAIHINNPDLPSYGRFTEGIKDALVSNAVFTADSNAEVMCNLCTGTLTVDNAEVRLGEMFLVGDVSVQNCQSETYEIGHGTGTIKDSLVILGYFLPADSSKPVNPPSGDKDPVTPPSGDKDPVTPPSGDKDPVTPPYYDGGYDYSGEPGNEPSSDSNLSSSSTGSETTNSTTKTTTNRDGSTTVTETQTNGIVKTTTTDKAGNVTTETKSTSGTVTTIVSMVDGTTANAVQNSYGTITAQINIPTAIAEQAQVKGVVLSLPIPEMPVAANIAEASAVTVMTNSTLNSVKVEIPLAAATPGTVAVLVKADGTQEIVTTSIANSDSLALTVPSGACTVKVIDNAKEFNDTASHWGKDAVSFVSARALFNGTGEKEFSPDADMTRGMLMTVLARYDGQDTTIPEGANWYTAGMNWARENGISDGTKPESIITRQELATMLYRYAGSPEVSVNLGSFNDGNDVAEWATPAMSWAISKGIIGGTSATTLAPTATATRAQVASILMRFTTSMAK